MGKSLWEWGVGRQWWWLLYLNLSRFSCLFSGALPWKPAGVLSPRLSFPRSDEDRRGETIKTPLWKNFKNLRQIFIRNKPESLFLLNRLEEGRRKVPNTSEVSTVPEISRKRKKKEEKGPEKCRFQK